MFQAIRKHINPATILALVALVFAITGGAFAATGSGGGAPAKASALVTRGTSVAVVATTKAKSKTKAGPRGPAGPKGATGATGPAGPVGPAGAAGAKGETGATGTGTPGVEGHEGKEGPQGHEGKEGKPGVIHPGETLPAGASETGAWAFGEGSAVIGASGETEPLVPISFNIPLKEGIEEAKAHFVTKDEWESRTPAPPTECEGTPEKPEAEPGSLCVYEDFFSQHITGGIIFNPGSSSPGKAGAGPTGADVKVMVKGAEGEAGSGTGTWIVTAPKAP